MAVWKRQWLAVREDGDLKVPAIQFLKSIPASVKVDLLAKLEAVSQVGPDRWLDNRSHTRMEGDLDHLHEVRDKLDDTLYRLFVQWLRDDETVVVIDGRTKPNNSVIEDAEYQKIREMSEAIEEGTGCFATVDELVKLLLEEEDTR